MVRSKYTFEKRQKELARQKKQADKAARKAAAKKEPGLESEDRPEDGSDPALLNETGEPGE